MSPRFLGTEGHGLSQQRTFSAPSSLRYTPATSTLEKIPIIAVPPSPTVQITPPTASPAKVVPTVVEAVPPLIRSHSSPYPPSTPAPFSTKGVTPSPTSPIIAEKAGNYIRRRLSLSNYVAPGSGSKPASPATPISSLKDVGAEKKIEKPAGDSSLVTPPSTPPTNSTELPPPTPAEKVVLPPPVITTIVGGMPATVVHEHSPVLPSEHETPFSPKSTKAPEFGSLSSISATAAGLISPPRSQENSEDGSGDAGRGSPEGASTPAAPLSGLGLRFTGSADFPTSNSHNDQDQDDLDEQDQGFMGRMSDLDALIKQWCFAQSAPPTPGVHVHSHSPSDSSVPTPPVTSPAPDAKSRTWGRSASPSASDRNNGYGGGGGYGFPGFMFGVRNVNADVGVVGGE